MLILCVSSAHTKHTRHAITLCRFAESQSVSVGQSSGTNRIMFMWLLTHQTVVFAFYWLHFLYGHILKYLYVSFYMKYNLSSKLFILLITETTFWIQEVLLLPFHTWETEIFGVFLHTISSKCQSSVQANMFD